MALKTRLKNVETGFNPTLPHVDTSVEVMRLKAQVVSLNERLARTSADLSNASASVKKGNMALTTERAQYLSEYATLLKTFNVTKTALSASMTAANEDTNHATEIQNLHCIKKTLATNNAELRESLTNAEADNIAKSMSIDAHTVKFTKMAAQHAVLLDERNTMTETLYDTQELLSVAESAIERAETREIAANIASDQLRVELEGLQRSPWAVEPPIDDLDGKVTTIGTATKSEGVVGVHVDDVFQATGYCPATVRCEEMEQAAKDAHNDINGASEHDYERLHSHWEFLNSLATRARHSLCTGEPEAVIVAHVYTGLCDAPISDARVNLALHIGPNPMPAGKTIDENYLHFLVDTNTGANLADGAGRTELYVEAVSEDLKEVMKTCQKTYKSCAATTGMALRV